MSKGPVVGIDVSPLYSAHQFRGIGFYTERLLAGFSQLEEKNLTIKTLKTKEEIEAGDFDLLHIPYFHPFFHSLPLKKRFPLVVTIHDLIPVKYPKHYPVGLRGDLFWLIQKFLLKRVDLIITDSFASKYDIAELAKYPEDKIFVTYLAAGDKFRKLSGKDSQLKKVKDKYHLPDTFVLYVGDVNWNKNVPGLVKACESLNFPLVVVGKQAVSDNFNRKHPENRDLAWLQDQVKNHLTETKFYIKTLGFVPTNELVAIYNLANVYCQPSFDEGFGLPVLEAMACGCPVVCSKGGSLPEVADEAAELVEPEMDSLAKGIKKVLTDPKFRLKISNLGRARAKDFSWLMTAKKTLSVYGLALEEKSLLIEQGLDKIIY